VTEKQIKVGDAIEFVDRRGQSHSALVTESHGTYGHSCGTLPKHGGEEGETVWGGHPCINLLYVTKEEGKRDSWGAQIERESSIVHRDQQGAHGLYWEFAS